MARYGFEIEKARLSFSQGEYLQAYDSLFPIEKKISSVLKIKSLLEKGGQTVFIPKKPEDSIWISLHMDVAIALATVYLYMDEYTHAIDVMGNLRIVHNHDSISWKRLRYLNAMGAIFARMGKIDQAISCFHEVLRLGKTETLFDLDKQAMVYSNLMACYMLEGNPALALKYALEAYSLLKGIGFLGEQYVYSVLGIGSVYESMQEYGLAERYLKQALHDAEVKKYNHLSLYIRSHLVDVMSALGKWDSARSFAMQNLREARVAENGNVEEVSFRQLSNIERQVKDFASALLYMDSAYMVVKKLMHTGQDVRMEYFQRRFENYRQEQENIQSEQELALAQASLKVRTLWIVVGCVLFVLFGVAMVLFYSRYKRQNRLNRLIKMRLEETESLNNNRMDSFQKFMRRELSDRDKELAAQALYHMRMEGLVGVLGEKLRDMRILFNISTKEKMYIMEMERLLKSFTPDKNWNEFELYFKRVDGDFFEKLEKRFPELTPNEKRLCALIRLNLTSKEIAELTVRTFRSVNTAKTRLKKKFDLDSNTNLYDFLASF